MRDLRHLAALLLLVLAGCAHVDPARELLDDLDIEGNEAFSDGALEERLALVETPDWPWADPQYFDRGTLAGDRRRLLRFYRAQGYYETKVKSRLKTGEGKVGVTFVVEEGKPTLVERVDVLGLKELPEQVLLKLDLVSLPVAPKDVLKEESHDAARAELLRRLKNAGYAEAEVQGAVEVDVSRRSARVRYEARPGTRYSFGKVIVSGSVKVPRARIVETVREHVPSGKTYDESKLNAASQALFDLGVFGAVRVSRGPIDTASGTVPVIVAIREAPFQTLRAGGGGGVDAARQEGRFTAEYAHRNFFGGLRRLTFENRFGYAFLDNGGTFYFLSPAAQGFVGASALEFTQPSLIGVVDGNLRLEYERGLEAAYDFDAVKGRIGLPVRLHRSLIFTPSYNLQFYDVRGDATASGRAELSADCNAPPNPDGTRAPCVLAYAEARLAWDRRNDPVTTTRGFYLSAAVQRGSNAIGSSFDYDRAIAEARYFQPFGRDVVLALRLETGVLLPADGQVSPIMERFYAGGGASIRSYGTRRLSPHAVKATCSRDGQRSSFCLSGEDDPGAVSVAANTISPTSTIPIGGDAILEGTVEVRWRLVGELGIVLFSDVGNVTRSWDEAGASGGTLLFSPNVALGTGLRYHTLFGPVRFDLAYRVLSQVPTAIDPATGQRLAVVEPPFSFHFSIGEAF